MLKHEGSTLRLKTSTTWARVCDTCRSAPCTIYCRADAAYLCTSCDARVHAASKLSFRHERVWVCESCEQAPAAFICKADAASLCATCDAEIHSANPLARRHHRVPVAPIPGSLYGPQATDPRTIIGLGLESQSTLLSDHHDEDKDEDEAASWLLFDGPIKNSRHDLDGDDKGFSFNGEENGHRDDNNNRNHGVGGNDKGFLFNGEGGVDDYLDLVEFGGGDQGQEQGYGAAEKAYGGGGDADRVVPVRREEVKEQEMLHLNFQPAAAEYEPSNAAGYGYHASLSHSVSMSSLDVGIVPDSKGSIDLFSNPPVQMPTQLNPMDREARVLRYREKKKTRKFEKTIRYASRKAYAETRPRIKGRFAKRTNVGVEVDQMFSTTTLMSDTGYGIVPSF